MLDESLAECASGVKQNSHIPVFWRDVTLSWALDTKIPDSWVPVFRSRTLFRFYVLGCSYMDTEG